MRELFDYEIFLWNSFVESEESTVCIVQECWKEISNLFVSSEIFYVVAHKN